MKILLRTLLLILLFAPISAFGQKANSATETLEENERISFMAERNIETLTAEPSSAGLVFRTLGALLLIGGLIFAGAWCLKKFGFGNLGKDAENSPGVAILSTVPLGNNRSLSVVRFGEQVLLVGATTHNFTLLAVENPYPNNDFGEHSRSVAELLAADIGESEITFADELADAINNFEDERRT